MEIELRREYNYFLDYDESKEIFSINEEKSSFEILDGKVFFKKESDPSRYYRADINVFWKEEDAKRKLSFLNMNPTAEITCGECLSHSIFDKHDEDFHINCTSENQAFFKCPVCGEETYINDDTTYYNEMKKSYCYKDDYKFYLDVNKIIKYKEFARIAKEVEKTNKEDL